MEVEKVLLLAEGLNPYIEFRSREVEAEVRTYVQCVVLCYDMMWSVVKCSGMK